MSKEGALLALCSAFMWSCYDIVCKYQAQDGNEGDLKQAFYSFLFSSIAFMPFALYQFVSMELIDILQIQLMSFMSLVNIVILFISFKMAPLFILMPFSYLDLVFTAVGSYFLLDQAVEGSTVYGSLIIVCATLFICYKKKQYI